MAEAPIQELSSANRIRELAGMPIEAQPAPKQEEPPAWSEIKESEDYKALNYPEQVNLARQWGAETKQYAASLQDYTPEQDAQIDDFVNKDAVDVPVEAKAIAGLAGLAKGAGSTAGGIGGAVLGGAGGMLVGGPIGAAVGAGVGGAGGALAGGEIVERGLNKLFPTKVPISQELAPGYAAAGEYTIPVVTGAVGAKQLVQAGRTLFAELGAKRAAQEMLEKVGTAAASGAALGTGVRAITGQEITPGTVGQDALYGALFAGLGSGTRVKGYNREQAIALNKKVISGKATRTEVNDRDSIAREIQRTGVTEAESAKRTTVNLAGRPVFEKTEVTSPAMRPMPTADLPPIRPAGLPESGVRGNVRGTQADTAEMQRRGIPSEFQESLIDLDYTPTRPTVFTIESQGGVLAPKPSTMVAKEPVATQTTREPLQGEIVREGQLITPRTQLPSTERLALPAESEPSKQYLSQIKRDYVSQGGNPLDVYAPERADLFTNELNKNLQSGLSQQEAMLKATDTLEALPPETRPDGSISAGYAPTEEAIKKGMIQPEALQAVRKAQAQGVLTVSSGFDKEKGVGFAVGRAKDGNVVRVEQKPTIPRPMGGKAGEAGFVTSEAFDAPARVAKNYLSSQGALTPEMADELLANKYNKAGMESAVQASKRDYKNALKEITGTTKESPELLDLVTKYLNKKISIKELPAKLQVPVEKYRNDIDSNSIGFLNEYANISKAQSETVEANLGSYMMRPYEKFTNKNWNVGLAERRDNVKFAKSVDYIKNQIIDEAKQEVEDAEINNRPPIEFLRKINETGFVPKDILMGRVQMVVEEGGLYQGAAKEQDFGSYGISKNLSMLKKKQDIPDEILYLLGEITDPSVRYVMTMQKLINFRVNNRTLQNLRDQGFKAGLFFDYPAPDTIQFAAEGSKTLEPLNGVYMSKDVANQIKSFDPVASSDAAYRTFAKLNAWIKKAKTVYSIKSQVRNFIFNIPIQIQNGNFSFLSNSGKTVKMIQSDYGFGPDTPTIRSSLRRAIKLGIVNNSKFNEMEALMRDANLDDKSIDNFIERYFSKIHPQFAKFGLDAVKVPKLVDEFMSYLYRSGDNFHKLQLWGYRTKSLMDGKGLSREQAEIEAAPYANNTFPTYEKQGRLVKGLRANIFAKNFISWDAERIRNTYHSLKYAIEDIKTPGMKEYGVRALLGNIMAFTISRSAQLLALGALGYAGKRKLDDLNKLAPRYQKDSTLVPVRIDLKKGEVEYIDFSFSDAYDVFNQPINAFMNAENLERGLASAVSSIVGNFLGISIATESAIGLIKNQRSDGTQITNPKASVAKQVLDYSQYAERILEPGTVSDMRQLFYAIKGEPDPYFGPRAPIPSLSGVISSFGGFRVQKINLADSLVKKAVTFNSDIAKSTSLLSSQLKRKGTPSESDITSGGMEMLRAREESFRDMRKAYKAAVGWGLSVRDATAAMREGNMSRSSIQSVVSGTLPKYKPGRNMMRDIAREMPDDIQRRQEILKSLLEEEQ